jgi:hypothetical protein
MRPDGNYCGKCLVRLEHPDGNVSGAATIHIDQNFKTKVEVLIEAFNAPPEYGDSLLGFLHASVPQKHGTTGTTIGIRADTDGRRIALLDMKTNEGTFTASSGLQTTPIWMGFEEQPTLSVLLNDLVFTPNEIDPARYWFLPLQGPFDKLYIGLPTSPHPMALGHTNIMTFCADGLNCGLQIFDAKQKPSHPLATYDAIAFGELRGTPATVDEAWDSVPRALPEALSFAIGADVVAPWFELRADDGRLTKRFYVRVGHRSSSEGYPAFCKINEFRADSGIGPFVQAFFSASASKREALMAPLNLIRSGTPGSFTVDDSITDLVKALDNVCKEHGLETQNLFARLDPDNQVKIESLLTQTGTDLRKIVTENRTAARHDQVDALNRILSRLGNVSQKDRDFGIAVKDLLAGLNLHDADVLDAHYASLNPPGSWAGLLSALRGEVIHRGVLRIRTRQSLREWYAFSCHLHDLCKRIVFREIGYTGMYYASTNPWTNDYAVDRVTTATTVRDLGLSQVPTSI